MKTHNTQHTRDITWTPRGFAGAFNNAYLDGDDIFAVLVRELERLGNHLPVSMWYFGFGFKRKGVGIAKIKEKSCVLPQNFFME